MQIGSVVWEEFDHIHTYIHTYIDTESGQCGSQHTRNAQYQTCFAGFYNFAGYFSGIYAPNNDQHAAALHNEYLLRRENYFGYPFPSDSTFNTEIVSMVMLDLKCGKAPDINGLTAEHLLRSHPILPVIL